MTPELYHQVVAARRAKCINGSHTHHTTHVKLADESEIAADDLTLLIDAGAAYHMIPPEGAPAYEAHLASGGLPLILQTRTCELCNERVLFA